MKKYWKKLKKKYPTAFKLLIDEHLTHIEWSEIDLPTVWGDVINEEHYILRHLYDFFDNNNIYMSINYNDDKNKFIFNIKYKHNTYYSEKFYNNRQQTELDMFMKSFEILENNI